MKCDSVNHLSNRKIRSDLTKIKTSMIYFCEWWEGKDLKILKVCEQTVINIHNNRALTFFVYFVCLDEVLHIFKKCNI